MANGFKKLIQNIKKNSLYEDDNGDFTKMNSSTQRRRYYEGKKTKNSKEWNPPKLKLTEYDLSRIWNEQNGKCHYFNIDLDMDLLFSNKPNYIPNHPLAPSVDRIDNTKDYMSNNVVICARFVNLGRGTFPYDEMKIVVDQLKKESK